MKIIFDSERQKELMLHHLANYGCPMDFNIFNPERKNCNDERCIKCWESCGIEMEVKTNV